MRKYKYEVAVTTVNIDTADDGNEQIRSFEIQFMDGDLPTMRREAFLKAKDLVMFFEDEMPEGHEFESGSLADSKGIRIANVYYVDIVFFIDDLDYIIEDDYVLQADSCEVEKREFLKNGFDYPFEIPDYDDTYDVRGNDFSHSPLVNNTITKTYTKEHYQIDYAVAYDFNAMEQIIKGSAKEMGVSVKKYLKYGKKRFRNLRINVMKEIAESNDPIYIGEMIEQLNDAKCSWTLYDRYDFERKLKKGKI
jgi:hypothetical protein